MSEREMTLEEWVGRLHPTHRARRELDDLRAAAAPSAPQGGGVEGLDSIRKALADLVRAGKRFRNTVIETRGVRGMDEHDLALSAAEAALTTQPRTDASTQVAVKDGAGFTATDTAQQGEVVAWRREWQGSGPQRGFHIREDVHLHNNRVVAYLGDQVDGDEVDKLIAEHNGKHPNGEPIRTAPPSAPVGVAYLDIGAGGYMDLGSELSDEELAKLPYGRHVLGIIGTYGIDGYVSAPVAAAPVDLDALAVNRYRPVPDGLLAYKVVAGDGTRSLFSGTMNECNVVARKLTEAFLDGAYVASNLAAPGIDLQWLVEGLDEIGAESRNLRQGGCDAGDVDGLENGLMYATETAHELRDRLLALIEGQTSDAPVGVEAAKHWHSLYRKECQLRQDDAARYGQQIADLEALAQQGSNFYAITNKNDNDLFWSNEIGWVDAPPFDLFTQEERETLSLSDEGRWVQVAWKEFDTQQPAAVDDVERKMRSLERHINKNSPAYGYIREALTAQPAACVGCEGKPAPENSPCAVCGQQPAAVDEAMVERALNAYFADQCQLVDKESKLFRAMKAALTAALAAQPGEE